MRAILILAGKEIRDGLRNRWVVGATLLLAGLAFALTFLGSAPTGQLGVKPLAVTVVSLASLSIFLLPLIALLISYDSIVGETERGCMLLLLTYPVTPVQIISGKFLGHVTILALATVLGYGAAGVAAAVAGDGDPESWMAFLALIGSSVLLGGVFVALGILASTLVKERGTAAGLAIGLWLVFVVLFDFALLGLLIASKGAVGESVFSWLLLVNPADVYRLFNLTGFDNVRQFSGMTGTWAGDSFPPAGLIAVLVAWMAVPLGLAMVAFCRRDR